MGKRSRVAEVQTRKKKRRKRVATESDTTDTESQSESESESQSESEPESASESESDGELAKLGDSFSYKDAENDIAELDGDDEDDGKDEDYVPSKVDEALESNITAVRRSQRLEDTKRLDSTPVFPLHDSTQLGHRIFSMVQHQRRKHTPVVPIAKSKKVKKNIVPPPFRPTTWDSVLDLCRKTTALESTTMYKDCHLLPGILDAMLEIDKMIGLTDIKQALADHIIAQSQKGIYKVSKMKHITIVGPSGVGKTTLARNIARLFNKLGQLKTDKIVMGNRQNMIGQYLGHTDKNTQQVINQALGGCLLIDEAYSLGTGAENSDSFSQECINTLNQNLTEKGDQFQCIVVGYKESMEKSFFVHNPGLKRRFQWNFEVPMCNAKQLSLIMLKMLTDEHLTLDSTLVMETWFEGKMTFFPHSGGSVENLVDKVKMAHCRRVFGRANKEKGVITLEDLTYGYKLYLRFEQSQSKGHEPPAGMYT